MHLHLAIRLRNGSRWESEGNWILGFGGRGEGGGKRHGETMLESRLECDVSEWEHNTLRSCKRVGLLKS